MHVADPNGPVKVRPHVRRNAASMGWAPGGNYGYNTGGPLHVVTAHARKPPARPANNAANRGWAPGGNYGYNTGGALSVQGGTAPPGYEQPEMMGAAAPPPVVMQNVNGKQQATLGAYHRGGSLGGITDPAQLAVAHAQANSYARSRLSQMQRVASVLPPELQQQLAASQRQIDPAAAWRAISGAFAQQSQKAGFADPRYYLQYVLPKMLAGRAGQ